MTKKLLISLSAVVLLTAIAYLLFASEEEPIQVSSFEECVEAGYPVMESHPRQCSTPEGDHFVEELDDTDNVSDRAFEGCVITGCSSQVCSDEEVVTTCEWRDEYACYQTATCERQDDGECGWTITNELEQCLGS